MGEEASEDEELEWGYGDVGNWENGHVGSKRQQSLWTTVQFRLESFSLFIVSWLVP